MNDSKFDVESVDSMYNL